MPKKLKFRNIKKVGDLNVSIKMSGLEKFSMKVAEKISATKRIFSKIQKTSKNGFIDLSKSIESTNEWFDTFSSNLNKVLKKKGEEFNKSIKELIDNISKTNKIKINETKSIEDEIQGDITADDVNNFLSTLWENHELAQSKFIETGKEEYGEMALDLKVAINNIEEIKLYLIEHGKVDKVKYDYTFE
ncbi:MAG: hypothetical protein ACTSVY_07970 [Candidatus Helarchaeota archaeon]